MKKQTSIFDMTPRQIVRELDAHIIGQKEAKRAVAIALRNRWRRQQTGEDIREEILPNNILMIGTTGVGKTEIARRLASLAGAPFLKVEASKYTEVGYVGRDVEGMIRDLMEVAVSQVREEFTERIQARAEERVEEQLLDLLVPEPPAPKKSESRRSALDDIIAAMAEHGDEETDAASDAESGPADHAPAGAEEQADVSARSEERRARHRRTREKMRQRLRDGKMESAEVEIRVRDRGGSMVQMFGPMGLEEMGVDLGEMLGPMMGGRKKKRRVTVGEARSLLLGEEIDRMLDMDAVISEAVQRTEQRGIVFIDEIDKVAGGDGEGGGPDVSREGVQRDILPVVEGTRVTTKYGPVRSDHILFIAAGAFHTASPSDLIPELQGRFPIRVELDGLTKRDFTRILTEPRSALVKQYSALLAAEGVELIFEKDAIREVAGIAIELNERMEDIGARRLHTVMSTLLEETMFKLPSPKVKKVVVDAGTVRERLSGLIEDEDLSRYIL